MLKLAVILTILGAAWGLPKPAMSPGGRIVGGHEVDIQEYPWTLALLLHYQQYCGAVLIAPEWILTTGHCVDHGIRQGLAVRAGSTSKSIGGEIVDIIDVLIHPEYNPTLVDYDFAVCRLATPITIGSAYPVDLPEPHHPIEEGEIAHITGWGTLEYDGAAPDNLHAIEVPVVSREVCERIYADRITERMFCAGALEGGKDACQGDSGGPVVIDWHLAGLVSWGVVDCATPGFPGVYAHVSYVAEWIREVIEYETEPGPEPKP